ncbi:TfpX/TfpZ family type IV pilin accessory protein [Ramlibacter sp. Leaf400]|uniref:TfpX/TfpZ family type IV pilin accessory protein n=1 Tax=Ramlibacter sp. Leaf400 TaxID=1736365 RepID=UPI0006FF261B|nr:TfpX/TfpZ family type IV pilin accessory protein [Ramlibacter sp. Leaf400]KQT12374.1 pilus assembly protein [Ramlibacter sp. Leaf400]
MQQPSLILSDDDTAVAPWKRRVRAALVHLGLSLLLAVCVGLLVFAVWYPHPYREISGGRELFFLVMAVDVVLGPLLTLAVFNVRKPRAELVRDLAVVALLQVGGLAYGLWTVQLARPVHLVFEIDRFRVVHRVDIPPELESKTPPGIVVAPLGRPTVLSTRDFHSEKEKFEFTMAALQGIHLGARPDLWEPYAAGRDRILGAAKPLSDLKRRFPQQAAVVDDAVRQIHRDAATLRYLPMMARKAEGWTVLLDDRTAEILGFLPLDSF